MANARGGAKEAFSRLCTLPFLWESGAGRFMSSGFRRELTAICSAMRQLTKNTTEGFTRRSFPVSAGKSVSAP